MYRVLLVLILFVNVGFSQLTKECFDKNGVRNDSTSEYCIVGKKVLRIDELFGKAIDSVETYIDTVKAFYTGINRIKFIKIYDSQGYLNGNYIEYFPNGRMKERGSHVDGRKSGYVMSWYPDGKSKSTLQFQNAVYNYYETAFKIIHYSDSTGRQLVKAGNGFCNCRFVSGRDESGKVTDGLRDSIWNEYSNGKLVLREEYVLGKLIGGTRFYEGKEYEYKKFEQPPEFIGGLAEAYKIIETYMRYPVDAKRMQIEGEVHVSFVINKDGSTTDFSISKGISESCDSEALRLVKLLSEWAPGMIRGVPVQTKFVFPIKFKLG